MTLRQKAALAAGGTAAFIAAPVLFAGVGVVLGVQLQCLFVRTCIRVARSTC